MSPIDFVDLTDEEEEERDIDALLDDLLTDDQLDLIMQVDVHEWIRMASEMSREARTVHAQIPHNPDSAEVAYYTRLVDTLACIGDLADVFGRIWLLYEGDVFGVDGAEGFEDEEEPRD